MRGAQITAPARVRERSARPTWARPAAGGALAVLVAGVALVAAGAAAAPSILVPSSRAGFPGWLAGPLGGLGATGLTTHGFSTLLLVMSVAYVGVLALAARDAVPARWALGTVVALHAILLLAPPALLTTDLVGYLGYARLGALHGLDPYTSGAAALGSDAIHPFVVWHGDPSPYGPLFTLASYAAVPLGVAGGVWALKAAGVLCSLAIVWLVGRAARLLGREPLPAMLFVGLNPLLLVYAVGGAHNDLEMMACVMAAVVLALERREAAAGALAVAAVAVKASAVVLLAFLVPLAARRGRALAGAVAALVVVAVASLAVIGPGVLHAGGALATQGAYVSPRSPAAVAGGWVGVAAHGPLRVAAAAALVLALAVLAARAVRGADPLSGAAWAAVALLVATTWLMPWYLAWLLPLAALAPTAGPRRGALGVCAFLLATRVTLG